MGESSASRAAWLELRREREVVEEGHRFLEEKRILLARELLIRIAAYARQRAEFSALEAAAGDALRQALRRCGLEELQVYPPLLNGACDIELKLHSFLGVALPSAKAVATADPRTVYPPPTARPEVAALANRHAALLAAGAALAAEVTALRRLDAEYQRTQRRVRALEKVVLPELKATERALENALEEQDQEEAVRVHLAGRRG